MVRSSDPGSRTASFDTEFLATMDTKCTAMMQHLQQPICSYISSSEERVHLNLATLKDITLKTQSSQEKVVKDLHDFLHRPGGPVVAAGDIGSTTSPYPVSNVNRISHINLLLNRLYSTSDVAKIPRNHTLPFYREAPNIHTMKRHAHPTILVESLDVGHNVAPEDTHGMIQMMEATCQHGILLSQTSGFSAKPNYHIESHHGYLLVYVHQVEYNPDKIRLAIEVIDTLSSKMKQMGILGSGDHDDGECAIDKALLDHINQEYQQFLVQKETMIQHLRESHRKTISQVEDFRFPSLDKYLSTKFAASAVKHGHKCELCKSFNANNLKALAAHKRGCIRKLKGSSDALSEELSTYSDGLAAQM